MARFQRTYHATCQRMADCGWHSSSVSEKLVRDEARAHAREHLGHCIHISSITNKQLGEIVQYIATGSQ